MEDDPGRADLLPCLPGKIYTSLLRRDQKFFYRIIKKALDFRFFCAIIDSSSADIVHR